MTEFSWKPTMMPLHPQSSAATPAASTSRSPESPARQELHQAADEFEAMLLTSLWKSFKESSLGDSSLFGQDETGKTYSSLGLQAMSMAVASSGGFGIGSMIEKQLAPDLKQDGTKAAPLPPLPAFE